MCIWIILSYPEFQFDADCILVPTVNSHVSLLSYNFTDLQVALCSFPHPYSVILVLPQRKALSLDSICLLLYLNLSVLLGIVSSFPVETVSLFQSQPLRCLLSYCFYLLLDLILTLLSSFPTTVLVSACLSPFEFEFVFSCLRISFIWLSGTFYLLHYFLLANFLEGCSMSLASISALSSFLL